MKRTKVLFLGPLPPPVHGFSSINLAMLERLQGDADVFVFDRSPATTVKKALAPRLIENFHLFIKFYRHLRQGPIVLYTGLSGGYGQVLDLPFIVCAKLFGARIFLHHHSFAYLNHRSKLAALLFYLIGRADHIVLCVCMSERLTSLYNIQQSEIRILSNAAFLPDPVNESKAEKRTPHHFTVGFLSNITYDKGIFTYFEVMQSLKERGVQVAGLVAGPIAVDIEESFIAKLREMPEVRHIGAVYGEAKQLFFRSIDLLLFPSQYANEAEPLTIHEALSAGVCVVASNRGCIPGMIPLQSGLAGGIGDLGDLTFEMVMKLSLVDARHDVQAAHVLERERHRATLTSLVRDIVEMNRV